MPELDEPVKVTGTRRETSESLTGSDSVPWSPRCREAFSGTSVKGNNEVQMDEKSKRSKAIGYWCLVCSILILLLAIYLMAAGRGGGGAMLGVGLIFATRAFNGSLAGE